VIRCPTRNESTWQVPGRQLSAYAEGAAVLARLGLLTDASAQAWNRRFLWQRQMRRDDEMAALTTIVAVVAVLALLGLALSVRIVQQYESGVLFRLGRVVGVREPGLRLIVPLIEVLRRVSLRIVTMPIQSQGIITRDNVSIDVSAVAYYRVTDAVRSVVAIENVAAAINQIAQTTLRKVVGQHTLDQTLAETDTINVAIREILDGATEDWGVVVTLVELKDIQLPETMQRAMARQAEAEREKRAKIIAAEGEALAADQLGAASDVMMAHPLALQLRNLQSLVEIGVDKNTTVVFPAPLMTTIQELGAFLAREAAAITTPPPSPSPAAPTVPAQPPPGVDQGAYGAPTTGRG
jgi:regulator of protease activity HflC (stomatin/prohibitin superfamily)